MNAGASVASNISYDAVVVVPGIMGSRLRDSATGDLLWGYPKMIKYSALWASPKAFARLALTAQELEGKFGRVVPDGILQFPAVSPFFRGIEAYGPLVKGIRRVLAHDDALLEFGYDWRLSVEHNARSLAHAARAHLDRWRAHEAHAQAPVPGTARLVIVAHSMGGLLARALSLVEGEQGVPEVTPDIRTTVTLGTPFAGAVSAAMAMAHGESRAPLHRGRLQRLAVKLPGMYDLLPTTRCVEDRGDVRRLACADIEAIGGSADMAKRAFDFHAGLGQTAAPPGHRVWIGTHQTTQLSLHLDSGALRARPEEFVWDGGGNLVKDEGGCPKRQAYDGDGTVGRDSAHLEGAERGYLPQQHGALASSSESVRYVEAVITERTLGPRAGEGEIGIEVPEAVALGERWAIRITGGEPASTTCRMEDADTGQLVDRPSVESRDGALTAHTSVDAPGVYRVAASDGGTSPVTQLVLAVAPSAG